MFRASTLAVLVVVAATFALSANAAGCNTEANITYPPNLHAIYTAPPVFVKRVPNGELYMAGNASDNTSIYLLHLYGNDPYSWGYAAGSLIGKEANQTLSTAWNYFENQIIGAINSTVNKYGIPPSLVETIINFGLEVALSLQFDLALSSINPAIVAEMHGLADASGVSFDRIKQIHMIGEITRGRCSLFGAWGNATLGSKTLQLRALDWDTGAGLQNFPSVTIYHPTNASAGYPFANVGWTGWIGTLTGMSSNNIGISEIGISYPDYPPLFGDESMEGLPFIFLERQILQYGKSVYDAMDIINNTNRTCHLMLGVADANAQTARLVQYSHSIVRFFDDTDLEPLAWWHPRLPNVVYAGMDWFCPFYQFSLYKQLELYHGSLTPELAIMNVTAAVGTGDLHCNFYDLTDGFLYTANHAPDGDASQFQNAYERSFVRFNMTALYAKPYGQN